MLCLPGELWSYQVGPVTRWPVFEHCGPLKRGEEILDIVGGGHLWEQFLVGGVGMGMAALGAPHSATVLGHNLYVLHESDADV